MNTEYRRAIVDAVARITATNVVDGESPEKLRQEIAERVADLGKQSNGDTTDPGPEQRPGDMLAWGSRAVLDVAAERRRQVEVEGWTPEHDDQHAAGGMGIAAACYAVAGSLAEGRQQPEIIARLWPWTGWSWTWWKPKDRRHNLVRAGALILAEIERLDRSA